MDGKRSHRGGRRQSIGAFEVKCSRTELETFRIFSEIFGVTTNVLNRVVEVSRLAERGTSGNALAELPVSKYKFFLEHLLLSSGKTTAVCA